jgi:hypothetical protein
MLFENLGSRHVVADFSGGYLSSDGGALLLRQLDRGLCLSASLAGCFQDERDPRWVEHALPELLSQRLIGMALGYEDLNDHNSLRRDPLLAVACEKRDPLGAHRLCAADRGKALASAPTLNRLELGGERADRYHKITHDPQQVEQSLLTMGVRCLPKHAPEVIVDLDATGMLLHGEQQGRHFHAYYGDYCYLPLYAFVGNIPLWAQLRTADRDASDGAVAALTKIVAAIRRRMPGVRILVRADSGFCREELLAWCEGQREVYYCIGLAQNARLLERIGPAMAVAHGQWCLTGGTPTRRFIEFGYQTLASWSRERRVIGKAEMTKAGANPRFVVTNLPGEGFAREEESAGRFEPAALYEQLYCARGEMENVLKQQLLDMRADRMSTHEMGSNQLRLWLATFAYLLVERLRTLTLSGTEWARATVGTIRRRLLKVAAEVRVSVRRVHVRLCSAFPLQELYRRCHRQLGAMTAWDG